MGQDLAEANPLVSIVIPTFNEERDICATLDAILRQRYRRREIIVVDESTDDTPDILKEYEPSGVMTLRPEQPEGRCGARNLGIINAKGEIVVILNADVLLPEDFLDRILVHYRNGADYVLIQGVVANGEHLFPRFLDAQARREYQSDDSIEWTEGFSCRRQAALDVGMFPVGYPIPLCAGEDGIFGLNLAKSYRKVVDRRIAVHYIMPETLEGYWHQQWGRGRGTPLLGFFAKGRCFWLLSLRALAKTLRAIGILALLVPGLCHSAKVTRYSDRGWRDILLFWYAYSVQLIAQTLGEWDGMLAIWQEIRKGVIKGFRWTESRYDSR